jgi:hypothetical protein
MARPSRAELIRKFFPDLGKTGSGGDTEAAIELNTRAAEAVLADLIQLFDQGLQQHGPGVLCLNLTNPKATHYAPLSTFCEDLSDAERLQDYEMSGFLKQLIAQVRLNDFEVHALMLLADRSCQSLLPIPRSFPAERIRELQQEATL